MSAVFCIDVADSLTKRLVGLLFKRSYSPHHMMWFISCFAIHTWGMLFAIDVIFLDKQGRLLKIVENVQPWRWVVCWGAYSVLECQAGTVKLHSLQAQRGSLFFGNLL